MVKKIQNIRSIGKFKDYKCSGDVEFNKLNIVYAENGSGKTTLSDIFRSLKFKDSKFILRRHTLGSKDKSLVKILDELNITHTYTLDTTGNYNWDTGGYKNLEIFDNFFIEENVYSGQEIKSNNLSSLTNFILNTECKAIIKELKKLKENNKNTVELDETKTRLLIAIAGSKYFKKLEDYINLGLDTTIDTQISTLEKQISNLSSIDITQPLIPTLKYKGIIEKSRLAEISVLLSTTPSGINDKFIKMVVEQKLKLEPIVNAERWLEYGLKNINTDQNSCPFCSQDLSSVE